MEGVIFIGIQASGKSTFCLKKFYKTHIRLNLDMLKTRHRENILLRACLAAKQPVVIDNTNPEPSDRRRYIELFKTHRFRVIGYYFNTPLATCLERNYQRLSPEKIPEVGIRGTYAKLVLPDHAEGFDQLYSVSTSNGEFKVEAWKNEV
ncbi:MAG: ATP-binding protein [Cyanothece sp. SIO1E1]|nr:ATP-binding protein [Cyanothece sp. SIO1E1]